MNIIDIIILCCCIPAVIHGVSKGFVSQAYSLLALVLGVWLSFKFAEIVGDYLSAFLEVSPAMLHIIAFALILVVVMLLITLAGKAVTKVLKIVMLGWLDKLLGVVFALIKALLIVGLVVIIFDAINTKLPFVSSETIEGSVLYRPIKDIADMVFPYLKELIFKK